MIAPDYSRLDLLDNLPARDEAFMVWVASREPLHWLEPARVVRRSYAGAFICGLGVVVTFVGLVGIATVIA